MSKNPVASATTTWSDLEGTRSPGGTLYYKTPEWVTGRDVLDYNPDTDDGRRYPTRMSGFSRGRCKCPYSSDSD